MDLHHRAVLDMADTLIDEGVADPKNIFLLGFSQTCALNYRFAFTHGKRLRGVIGICGGIPGDWKTSDRYKQPQPRCCTLPEPGMSFILLPGKRLQRATANASTRRGVQELRCCTRNRTVDARGRKRLVGHTCRMREASPGWQSVILNFRMW